LLDLGGTAHRINDTPELDQHSVAGVLYDAPAMLPDFRIEELAKKCLEPLMRSFFVRPISRE
jgi:hypothetical protein